MAPTIFYSWQSDTPSKTNHVFIKTCLEEAIDSLVKDGRVEEAPRLDHDMKGTYGDEDVYATILEKIDACDIFVADVTIVALTKARKQIPNPNVLLELGYASKTAGSKRIIKVMNTAYGVPEKDKFPFDMAHKRWPYQFYVPETMTGGERDKVRPEVVTALADIIHGILTEVGEKVVPPLVFPEAGSAWKNSSFLTDGTFGRYAHPSLDNPLPVTWENGLQWFLRLIPLNPMENLSFRDLFDHISRNHLLPFGGYAPSLMVNEWGAASFDFRGGDRPARGLSQLFHTGEIWGIERAKEASVNAKALPFSYVVSTFTEGLAGYLRFLRENLKVEPPVKLIAGVSGVKDIALASPRFMEPAGLCPGEEILYDTILDALEVETEEVLHPFFQKVWGDFTLPGVWDA